MKCFPLNLTLTCRKWFIITNGPYAKTEWLIIHYGKAHAIFYALRLSPTFIDTSICQNDIVTVLTHLGYDQQLLEHNVCQLDAVRIHALQSPCWIGNLPTIMMSVFTHLLDEKYKQFYDKDKDLTPKENDLVHFSVGGPHFRTRMLKNERFTPYPSIPKSQQLRSDVLSDPACPSNNGRKLTFSQQQGSSR